MPDFHAMVLKTPKTSEIPMTAKISPISNLGRMLYRWSGVLLLLLLSISAGCDKTPEAARRELGQLGIQYTPEAFMVLM
jgi:hypothetical protein